jgi:hypothetical protein
MNIYHDYGKVITSERYIVRNLENEIKKLLLGGIISVVGLPRVGKTSMVEHILSDEKNYIKLTFGSFDSADEFFEMMIEELYSLIEEDIERYYERALKKSKRRIGFKYFYEAVSKYIDNKLYIFIDEFDYADKILSRSDLEVIRDIFSQSRKTKDKYNLILVSRRRIFEIEGATNASGSTLQGVVNEKFLSLYKGEEVKRYFEILENYVEVNEKLKNQYKKFTGYHPYLSDIISYNLIEYNKSVEEVYQKEKILFFDYFSHIYRILEEKRLFDALLSIIFNLPFAEENKIDILKSYGIINEEYEIFCEPFLEYCKEKFEMIDFYNIWHKTENALRKLIKDVLSKNYNSLNDVVKKYNEEKFLKDATFYLKQQRKSKFAKEKGENFIDGLSTTGLFKIIINEWYFFEPIFKKNRDYWFEIFRDIKEIRNLVSHTKEIDKNVITKANIFCEEILKSVDNYFRNV